MDSRLMDWEREAMGDEHPKLYTGKVVMFREDQLARFAAFVSADKERKMLESGYRKCADGQHTSQFCGQVEAYRTDAERYRWLRNGAGFNFSSDQDVGNFEIVQKVGPHEGRYHKGDALDVAVDEAIHARGGKG